MAGRPPAEKSFAAALRIEIKEAGSSPQKDKLREIAEKLVSKAIDGEIAAIKEVADRLDGKATQAIDHSGSVSLTLEEALEQLE